MFSSLPVIAIAAFAAADVWVASPAVRVFPDSRLPTDASREIYMALARGEYESVQIAVRAKRATVDEVAIDVEADSAVPVRGPDIREVAYVRGGPPSERAVGVAPLWPDPLIPYVPKPLAPGHTRVFWLTYSARPDAAPGVYASRVRVSIDEKKSRNIDVSLEVFDFDMPRTPSLAALHSLERAPVRRAYGFDSTDLLRWQAIYDALADYRIAYNVWSDEDVDPDSWSNHMDYAAAVNPMRVVDLGTPADFGATTHDKRAVVSAHRPERRADWEALRANLRERGTDIRRVLSAPLHPYWENDVDVWAIPFDQYNRDGRRLLETRHSLAWSQGAPAIAGTASSGDEPTAPRDGYDGSLFSYWAPLATDRTPAFTVELATPVTVDSLLIAWMPGQTPQDVKFYTSRDAVSYTPSTVRWSVDDAEGPHGYVWWEGSLRVEKTFSAFRLELSRVAGQRVELAEVSFELYPHYPPRPDRHLVEPWLAFDGAGFPSLALDAPVLDYRIRPWLCWALDLNGFTAGALTDWPVQFYAAAVSAPATWPPGPLEGTLIYPAPGRPLPSIRLMHLRDGMEDYEYLAALTHALEEFDGDVDLAWVRDLVARNPSLAEAAQRRPSETLAAVLRWREEIGRGITALAAGQVPRDPKGFAR